MTRWHTGARAGLAALFTLCSLCLAQAPADDAAAKALAAAQTRLDKARDLLSSGQPKAVLEQLAEVKRDTTLPIWVQVQASLYEGRAQYALEDYKAAVAACVKVVELTSVPAGQLDWPQRPEAMLLLADARRAAGLASSARDTYRELVDRAPHSHERMDAARSLIYMDLDDGNLDPAAKAVDAYVKAFPWDQEAPRLIEDLAREYQSRGKPVQAIERFGQVQRDYAGSESAWASRRPLVDALLANKQNDEALAALEQLLTIRPEMLVVADATGAKADLLVTKGDVPGALALLEATITRYADCYVGQQLRLQKADIRRAAGDLTGAVADLTKLLADFPQPYWQVITLRGLINTYRAQKDWDKAEDTADALAKLTAGTPTAAQALLEKAQIQFQADRKRAAGITLDRLIATYKGAPYVSYATQFKNEWK
ncbi:MAG: tetratricopeptide repeat protein [Armatimonadetes bacterium]|nr:tetratricopeptide repeat protein [Armatimonadota bacterium]